MKPLLLTWMSVMAALTGLAGCATRGGLGALQTELRQREDQISNLNHQLGETQKQLEVAKQEKESLRSQLSRNVSDKLLPEQSDLIFRAQGLKFSEYLTSGVDRDGQPGDELVSILLTPQDGEGDALRLPGKLKLEVRDLNNPEGRQLLGSWTWEETQIGEKWHQGFLASGYHLEVPLKIMPQHPELTLHAQLTTPDGRQFSATQPIKVRLPDGTENVAGMRSRRSSAIREVSNTEKKLPRLDTEPSEPETDADVEEAGVEEAGGNPFDEEEAARERTSRKVVSPKGERRTETSDRFRSFDPPRYQ